MIKIVSGIDPEQGGYSPKIWSSHKNTENFMSEEAVSNGAKSVTEDADFFSIHFFAQYIVFSKHKIVLDAHGADRIGTISFSVAFSRWEQVRSEKILTELVKLQEQFKKGDLDFDLKDKDKPDAELPFPKSSKNKRENLLEKKDNVYLYFNSDQFNKYFRIKLDYQKYKKIFFINEERYKGTDDDPAQSIQSNKEISFEELEKPFTDDSNQEKPKTKEKLLKRIISTPIVIALSSLLIGITVTLGFQKNIIDNNNILTFIKQAASCSISDNYKDSSDDLRITIAKLESTIKQEKQEKARLEDSIIILNRTINQLSKPTNTRPNNNNISDNRGSTSKLPQEMIHFLKEECKTMTLNSISEKIKSFPNWNRYKNMIGFANFIELMKINPPTKQHVEKFMKDNKSNFNNEDEYVKFVNYLTTLEDNFFTNKKMEIIENQTLKDIELNYDFIQ